MSPDSDSSYFDWSDDGVCSMLLELRVGNVDLESTNYVYSMQISPIELEFDHNQATLGEFCNLKNLSNFKYNFEIEILGSVF